jgi:hypothetical protein
MFLLFFAMKLVYKIMVAFISNTTITMHESLKDAGLFISYAGALTLCQTILDKSEKIQESMRFFTRDSEEWWNERNVDQRTARRKELDEEFIKKLGENAYNNVVHLAPVFLAFEHYKENVLKHPFKFRWLGS